MIGWLKCLFGRHWNRYYTDQGERIRECTWCGRRWRRVRYDMVLAWVRIPEEK